MRASATTLPLMTVGSRPTSRGGWWSWLAGAAAALAIYGLTLGVIAATTPHLSFNDGYGYLDGRVYAAMAAELRGASPVDLPPEYVYRILPIAMVAASPLDLLTGFLVLNLIGYAIASVLLYVLLRGSGVSPTLSLFGVLWWAMLPAGVRLSWYYPALIDGIGYAFLLALLLAAIHRRPLAFALLLPPAILTRENLVSLIPFFWLAMLRSGMLRATATTCLAAMPAVAFYVAVRVAPVIVPAAPPDVLADIRQNFEWFKDNAAERAWRFFAAPALTLGVVLVTPIARVTAVAGTMVREPAWVYYLVSTLVLAVIGGGDYDRFMLWLAPALLALGLRSLRLPQRPWDLIVLAALTALHAVLVGFAHPMGPDEDSYRSTVVAIMPVETLVRSLWHVAALAALAVAAVIAFKLVFDRWRRPQRAST